MNVQWLDTGAIIRFVQTLAILSGCIARGPASDGTTGNRQFSGETPNGDWTIEVLSDSTVVTFAGEDASLRLEALNGAERPADVQEEHPELGKYDVDLRVIDRNGIPWIMALGGDEFAISSWADDYAETVNISVDDADREAHYELFPDVREALDSVGVSDSYQLGELRDLVRSQSEELRIGRPKSGFPTNGSDTGGTSVNPPPPPSTTYTHWVYVYYRAAFWVFGDHSSTRAVSTKDGVGTTMSDLSYGNHGYKYTDARMSFSCGNWWSGRASATLHYSPYSGSDTAYGIAGGGCSTVYDAIYPTAGGHVCNDDSYAQYGNVKNDANIVWSTCSDSTLRQYVPVCSSI